MRRRVLALLALAGLALGGTRAVAAPVPEADRLWVVGARAFEDGLFDLAYAELGRFLAAAPGDRRAPDARLLRGKAAFALGRSEEALAEFRALEGLPVTLGTPGEALFWEGEVLYRLRQFAEASDRYGRLAREFPDSPYLDDALYARGFAELELGRAEAAVASFLALLRGRPKSELAESAAYAAARELVRARRWEDALPILGTYASRYPGSRFLVEVRYLLGVAQIEAGQRAEGTRTLEQFLAAAPTHDLAPAARILLAETYARAGRPREALEQYRAYLKRQPGADLAPQALYQIGQLALRLGRAAEAESAWKALREEHPQDPLAALAGVELASLYHRRRQYEQAMTLAREVADAHAEYRVSALLLLGESALKAGKTAEAGAAYQRALAEAAAGSPERFQALAGVGLIAESRNETDAARRVYQEIVEAAGDEALVRWAKGRLSRLEERERAPVPRTKTRPRPRSQARPGPA